MKVSAAVCETVPLGDADAVPGDAAAALDDAAGVLGAVAEADVAGVLAVFGAEEAAELADELHAVTSKAAQASAAPTQRAAACRALCEFVVHMDFQPL